MFRRRHQHDAELAAAIDAAGLPPTATLGDLLAHHQAVGFEQAERLLTPPPELLDPLRRVRHRRRLARSNGRWQ